MASRGRASRSPQRKPASQPEAAVTAEPQNEDQAPDAKPELASGGPVDTSAMPVVGDEPGSPDQVLPPGSAGAGGPDEAGQGDPDGLPDDGDDPELEQLEEEAHDAASIEQTTDYTRCGGHVLTDHGWIPESQLEQLGATRTRVETE